MGKTRLAYGNRSLAALGIMAALTQGYHPLALICMIYGQTAGWLLGLLAGCLAALLLWPVALLLRRVPGADLMDLVHMAFGKPGAILYAMLLAATLTFSSGMILRETSEMAIAAVFPHTPQTFATTGLLLAAVYVAWSDNVGLVRIGRVLMPILLLSILFVMAGAIGWGRVQHLAPFWGPGPLPLLTAALPSAALIAPAVLMPMLAGDVSDRRHLVAWMTAVPILIGLALAVEKALMGMVFPYPVSLHITYPLHAAARIILGGRFFERMEGLWLFVWVSSTAALIGALLHAGARALSQAFGMRRHTVAVLPLAAVVLTIAFFSDNQADTIMVHQAAAPAVTAVALVLPAAVAAVAAWRHRGRFHAP
ncbi:MAG TPA: GerAB/ArcD/ProY family transporter [Symbiobacteriaceae bacterium]|nr:GerAB/ArcD/ProY family transporter [Symbiobacteriaceae bacterium]